MVIPGFLVFEERENRSTGRKTFVARERTNNKLNPHMASTRGFEPTLVGGECSQCCAILALIAKL